MPVFFGKNIKYIRNLKELTQEECAHALGLKRSTYSGYENGNAQPSLQQLSIFARYFGVKIEDLLHKDLQTNGGLTTDSAETTISTAEKQTNPSELRAGDLRILVTTVDSQNRENIELVGQKAKAGYTSGFADPEFVSSLPVFNLPFLSPNKKYRTFQISGDSMLPIPDGAYVTGEFLEDWHTIRAKTACIVLTMGEGLVFKLVENLMAEKGSLRLISLNPIYKPYEIPVTEVKEIWKFVHYISPQIPQPSLLPEEAALVLARMQSEMEQLKQLLSSNYR